MWPSLLVAAVVINDASFEDVDVAPNSFIYTPSSPDWIFVSTSGVIDPASVFASGAAPDGEQFGFVQNNTSFSQEIEFKESKQYAISYYEAGRIVTFANATGNLQYEISIDGDVFYTGNTTSNQPFELVEALFFTTAGMHTLKFEGSNPVVTDDTAYFDDIMIMMPTDLIFKNSFDAELDDLE